MKISVWVHNRTPGSVSTVPVDGSVADAGLLITHTIQALARQGIAPAPMYQIVEGGYGGLPIRTYTLDPRWQAPVFKPGAESYYPPPYIVTYPKGKPND